MRESLGYKLMKNIKKTVALAMTLCLTSAALIGCRSEAKLSEKLDILKSGMEKTISLESGEIMVYATFKTEQEIEKTLQSSVKESYTKFACTDSVLEYDLTQTEKFPYSDVTEYFDVNCEGGRTVVTLDGIVVDSEAPDIFEAFRLDYTVEEIDKIETIELDGQTLYTVTMKEAYAKKLSLDIDGTESVGTQVKFNYYIDSDGIIRTVVSEHTYEVVCGEVEQTVVSFCQTAIN